MMVYMSNGYHGDMGSNGLSQRSVTHRVVYQRSVRRRVVYQRSVTRCVVYQCGKTSSDIDYWIIENRNYSGLYLVASVSLLFDSNHRRHYIQQLTKSDI